MKKLIFPFALCVAVAAYFFAVPAFAQSTYSGLNHINNIINNTPGVTNVNVSGGVNSTATGNVNVRTPGGLTVPVPTSVTAKTSAAAIAAGAARIGMRALPWVGTALVVQELADGIKNSGWYTCPPPKFFCKKDPDYNPGYYWTTSYWQVYKPTAIEACVLHMQKSYPGGEVVADGVRNFVGNNAECWHKVVSNGAVAFNAYISKNLCPANTTGLPVSAGCGQPSVVKPDIGATESDLQQAATDLYNSDQVAMGKMRQRQKEVEDANPSMPRLHDPALMTTTMSAPPVTSAQTTVTTETLANPDGSTSTKTTKEQTTVTPTMGPGATVADPKITFPSSTTTSISTVNNTTNVTTTTSETTVVNPVPAVEPVKLPTDYNREGTQLQILQQLDGSTAPDAPVDQETRVATKVQETDTSMAAKFDALPAEAETDKALWFSWVWTPPVGACVASDYSGTVHGYAISFDICSTVAQIRDVLGWFFALLGAWAIYGQIFKKGD